MTSIHVLDRDFAAADALCDLLSRRRLTVTRPAQGDGKGAALLVASAAGIEATGGQKTLVDLARTLGAKRIAVIREGAPAFAVTEEMGGRIVTIALPATAARDMLADGALLAAADVLAAPLSGLAAADTATAALLDLAHRVAGFDVSVFINGPTGSGKEVLARAIHARSPRADKPFVAINCAAIPENMLEAILFGHEKGAFTGAAAANKGIVRAADGGTLMLDEISEMPLGLQAKLLRVLQERVVTPLGSQTEVAVDIRVIATSNRDMEAEIRKGTFREDLYYRLNVFPLDTLALAERPDDVPVLAAAMLRRHARPGAALPLLTPGAIAVLRAHAWPGNVRELENVMQRALVLQDGGAIEPRHIMLTARASAIPAAVARAA
jgi:two-component system, response regulator FlrC